MANPASEGKDYCYNVALNGIVYTSDVTKYSPNNIKTIIISPDGVAIKLFTNRNIIVKKFVTDKASSCFRSQSYKPMIKALTHRVCSSVEEIILCTGSLNGLSLPMGEIGLGTILDSTKGYSSQDELIKLIGDRFKRLVAISVTPMEITTFLNTYSPVIHDNLHHVSTTEGFSAKVAFIHKDDWYKGYYFRPKDYKVDSEGSTLYNMLHKTEKEMSKLLDNAKVAIDDAKQEQLAREQLDKIEDKCCALFSVYATLASSINRGTLSYIVKDINVKDLCVGEFAKLSSNLSLPNGDRTLSPLFQKRLESFGIKPTKMPELDDANSMKAIVAELLPWYKASYKCLMETLYRIAKPLSFKLKVVTRLLLRETLVGVYIPEGFDSYGVDFDNIAGEDIKRVRIDDAIPILAYCICNFIYSDSLISATGRDARLLDLEYWKKLYDNGLAVGKEAK